MNRILIRGLEISACHGVKEFEKTDPQPFVFDADIYYDFFRAAQSDDLDKTINYSSVCKTIAKVTTSNCFDLIEKLCYECAYAVMKSTPALRIDLTLYKPKAPMKQKFDRVGVSVSVKRTVAYLSLGSSMGDRCGFLDTGIQKLSSDRLIELKKTSEYIETEPYGGVADNKFLNCAVEIETLYTPRQLLDRIHQIESECGRQRIKRWGDRTLDIDIIFFGKEVIFDDDLVVPHPEYFKRDFVLKPLRQIAPDFICPLLHKPLSAF